MAALFRDIATQVLYQEIRQHVVPKAIREATDALIRNEQKSIRINPLVALVEQLLDEAINAMASRAVIGVSARFMTRTAVVQLNDHCSMFFGALSLNCTGDPRCLR